MLAAGLDSNQLLAAGSTGCGTQGSLADLSGFEDADANLSIDKTGCMDWNGFAPITWAGTAPHQTATKTVGNFQVAAITDAISSNDSTYKPGTKQDDACPAIISSGANASTPNKDDLARIYVAGEQINGVPYLYLAWKRAPQQTVKSDLQVAFEFNQSTTACANGDGLVQRTTGDLLIGYDFQSSGVTITLAHWTGTAWSAATTLDPSQADAAANLGGAVVDSPRPTTSCTNCDTSSPGKDEFGEAGIDLGALNLGNSSKPCETFGTVLGASRSSGESTTSNMEDLVGPQPFKMSNCDQPTVTTALQNDADNSAIVDGSSIPVGSTVHDTATLAGLLSGKSPSGKVQYTFFASGDCSGTGTSAGLVTLVNGSVPKSNAEGPLALGNYSFAAQYLSGSDPNYSDSKISACEPFTVAKAQPALSTSQDPASGTVGDLFKDKATLSSAVNLDGSGSISWTLYPNSNCSGMPRGADSKGGISSNGTVETPNGVTVNAPGTYYWVAHFSGDANNKAADSGCADEPVAVAAPAIKIVKSADKAQVNAGEQIGFTLTVSNSGTGDAHGVTLSDTLPTDTGLSWSIAGHGAGWGATCAINLGVLSCGPETVPAGTTQAGSTFTVHITSPTTAATAGLCPGGSGVINNTGKVTATNAGSDQDSASTCVAAPAIHIVKTPDAAQVNAGEGIGFTLTVDNSGSGDAHGVSLSDTLPVKSGLSWTIASQGAGWGSTCGIGSGVLSCGPKTVAAGTTQAASSFTVHIISPTTAATSGTCPTGIGVIDNTGSVTTTNAGTDQDSASTCVAAPAIHIAKTPDAAQVDAGDPIGFTLTVYNDGAGDAHGVTLSDALPTNAGLSWKIAGQGAGWNSSCAIAAGVLTCGPVTAAAGTTQAASSFTVHITSPTTAATGGTCPTGTGVVNNTGNVMTTNAGGDESSASTCVAKPGIGLLKTADAMQVSAGDPIGFTLTVYNTGTGGAKGTTLTDTLPVKAGLNWSIAAQGAGWAGSCAIADGVLTCGPVTVPAGTTLDASTFTVHVTSPTTAATGGTCPGTGVVDNTGNVTTANDDSATSSAATCVAAPAVTITKTADHSAPVNAGDQIGFTVEIKNAGMGAASGVTLSDPLPAGPGSGVTWVVDGAVGAPGQFVLAGAKGSQTLSLASGTLPAGADYKVHLTAQTSQTECGVYDNTATLTVADGSSPNPASAEESCAYRVDLAISKSGLPATQDLGQGNITWTMVVTNNGPDTDTGVTIADPMPAGNTYVSSTTTQGTCTGGAILNCTIGTMTAGQHVTITLVTTPSQEGTQTNTAIVRGAGPETNLANNTATASVQVTAPFQQPCVKVSKVAPRQLYVGRKTTLTIHLTQQGRAKSGVRVRITGKKFHAVTGRSNAKGVIKKVVKMKHSGVLIFTPLTTGGVARCVGRLGVTGVFTPPVTG